MNTMERNQLNLSKKVYLKLERVRSKNKDKISGLPNRNRIIEYLCDKELEG
jgi:PleD family two-component response regulator